MERLIYAIVAGMLVGLAAALWLPTHSGAIIELLDSVHAQGTYPETAAAYGAAQPARSRIAPPPVPGQATTGDGDAGTAYAGDSESYDSESPFAEPETGEFPGQPAAEPSGQGFQVYPHSAENTSVSADINQFESAQILARVGPEVILAGEVTPLVDQVIAANRDKIPAGDVEHQRMLLIQQRLKAVIETKAVVVDAKRKIPKEGWQGIQDQIDKEFEKRELADLLKKHGVKNRAELDAKLRAEGSSLEAERRAFGDKILARQWIQQQIKRDEEVPYEEIVAYYREHLADYEFQAKARWEQLTVRFDRFPNKSQAYAEIARLGNLVLDGKPFADVAKESSDGRTAPKGGEWDWTTQGSLVSTVLDQALFTLPPGRLSAILEDQQGFHIVRVIERTEAGRTPFTEAQVGIKKKIQDERWNKQIRDYLERLLAQTKVTTIFDDPSAAQVSGRPSASTPR